VIYSLTCSRRALLCPSCPGRDANATTLAREATGRAIWIVPESVSSYRADVHVRYLPPDRLAGLARIEVVVQSRTVGDLDWRSCSADSCRCAVIESVRVDHGFRRRGYATAAVRAAVELTGPGYTWSTTAVTGIAAQAFWSSMGWPPAAHTPRYCPHMTVAGADNLD
jgi:GNAT superfamily N-acetyltransferase